MNNKNPNARKTIARLFPEWESVAGKANRFICGMSGLTIENVLQHPDFAAYEKDSRVVREKKLRTGKVPKEFEQVVRMKQGHRMTRVNINFPVRSIVERRVVYQHQSQTIILNDCLKELQSMDPNSRDVVVTSPPYNIGLKYNQYRDDLSQDAYLQWLENISREIHRVLTPGGSFFLNIGGTNKEPCRPMDVCMRLISTKLFQLQNNIVWIKSVSLTTQCPKCEHEDKDSTYGHFKPINSVRFLNHCHEQIFHFTKNNDVNIDRLSIGVPYKHKSNINRWKHTEKESKVDLRCRGDVWFIPYKTVVSRKDHPAGYPVELVVNCLRLHGLNNKPRVLDPFLGAGTTLQACSMLGLEGVGIDMDECYCEIAKERLVNAGKPKCKTSKASEESEGVSSRSKLSGDTAVGG